MDTVWLLYSTCVVLTPSPWASSVPKLHIMTECSMTDKLYELSFCGKRIFNHDRRCTYNVTLRGVRITIVAAEKQLSINYYYCVCPYSCLSYPACKWQIASILRLKMIWMRSKHVGAFLSVLIWTF